MKKCYVQSSKHQLSMIMPINDIKNVHKLKPIENVDALKGGTCARAQLKVNGSESVEINVITK